jgi:MFS family permease
MLFSAAAVFYPAAPKDFPVPFFIAGGILGGYAVVAYNITQVSFRQAICPERLQGRMNASIRFMVWGTMPIGALTGGALATWIGLRPAIWVGAIGALFTFLPILLSPVRSIETMPEPLQETVADEALGPHPVAASDPHA